jgi:hypothetical protein
MNQREFYLIRRSVTKDYYACDPGDPSQAGKFGTTDSLVAIRFSEREEVERLGRGLSRWGEAVEIVRVRITVEELQVSLLPSPTGRVVD